MSESEIYDQIKMGPKTPPEIASNLGISPAQARTTLNRLVHKKKIIKIGKHGRAVIYTVNNGAPRQTPPTETKQPKRDNRNETTETKPEFEMHEHEQASSNRNETTETRQPKRNNGSKSSLPRLGDAEFTRILHQQIPYDRKDLTDHIKNRGVGDEYAGDDLATIRRRFEDLLDNLNWILDHCGDSKPAVIQAFQSIGILAATRPTTPTFTPRELTLLKDDIEYLKSVRRIRATAGPPTVGRERAALFRKIKHWMKHRGDEL